MYSKCYSDSLKKYVKPYVSTSNKSHNLSKKSFNIKSYLGNYIEDSDICSSSSSSPSTDDCSYIDYKKEVIGLSKKYKKVSIKSKKKYSDIFYSIKMCNNDSNDKSVSKKGDKLKVLIKKQDALSLKNSYKNIIIDLSDLSVSDRFI